eukprot:scaffold210737_cov22-Tisochrysis_lutea.AAC.2
MEVPKGWGAQVKIVFSTDLLLLYCTHADINSYALGCPPCASARFAARWQSCRLIKCTQPAQQHMSKEAPTTREYIVYSSLAVLSPGSPATKAE